MTSSDAELARFGESVRIQRRLGVKDSRVIYPDEIKALMPFMDVRDIKGALYGPSDGMTDGSQLTGAFADEAASKGAEVLQDTKVTAISREGDKYEVTTGSVRITAKNVVNVSGAWVDDVASLLGLQVSVKPVRRQIVQLGVSVPNAENMPFFIDMKSRLYMHGAGTPGMVLAGIHDDMALERERRPLTPTATTPAWMGNLSRGSRTRSRPERPG
jgi:sarcosine oxidase, subunit beta